MATHTECFQNKTQDSAICGMCSIPAQACFSSHRATHSQDEICFGQNKDVMGIVRVQNIGLLNSEHGVLLYENRKGEVKSNVFNLSFQISKKSNSPNSQTNLVLVCRCIL